MYVDDLAIVAESRGCIQEALEGWTEVFNKHGIRLV